MEQLIDYIVRGLVDQPDAVRVNRVDGKAELVIEVQVAEADLGRVRGDKGKTLEHITAVVTAASGGQETLVELVGRDAEHEE